MEYAELQAAIEHTKVQIHEVKGLLARATDPSEKHRLKRQLRELQHLQLWRLNQLG